MKENDVLFEGFWDTLITKAKQGAFAVAGAAGSGTAKGKLTVSLLSDSMYSQFKEFLASTGSDTTPQDFADFLGRMGFSQQFVADESSQFKKFLNATDPINNPANRAEPTAGGAQAADAQPQQAPRREQGTIDRGTKRSGRNNKPFPNAKPADSGDAAKPAADAQAAKSNVPDDELPSNQRAKNQDAQDEINAKAVKDLEQQKQQAKQQAADKQRMTDQKAIKDRMQQKKAEGPRAKKTREGVEDDLNNLLMEKVSDGDLRKFFNTLAQRALKSGEAKSAAQKTIANTRTSNAGGDEQQAAAPAQGQAQAPAQGQAQAPAAAPAQQQAAAPAQAATRSGRKNKAFPGASPAKTTAPARTPAYANQQRKPATTTTPAQQPAATQAPAQPQAQTAPATAPAAAQQPTGTTPSGKPVAAVQNAAQTSVNLTTADKQLLDAYPPSSNPDFTTLVKNDPTVQSMAARVMKQAWQAYVAAKTPAAQPAATQAPAPATAQPAAPANQQASNDANPQAPAA